MACFPKANGMPRDAVLLLFCSHYIMWGIWPPVTFPAKTEVKAFLVSSGRDNLISLVESKQQTRPATLLAVFWSRLPLTCYSGHLPEKCSVHLQSG